MEIFNQLKDKLNFPRNSNRKFFLKIETNGFLPYNTATITVKIFKDKDFNNELPNCTISWYREIEK